MKVDELIEALHTAIKFERYKEAMMSALNISEDEAERLMWDAVTSLEDRATLEPRLEPYLSIYLPATR